MKDILKQNSALTGRIKMKELSLISGISKATIYNYLKIGILHPPNKVGLSLAVYDMTHLAVLKRIRELREKEKIPLRKMNKLLLEEKIDLTTSSQEEKAELLISLLEEEKRSAMIQKNEMKKIEILDAAIALFSKKGYETFTIEDIADSLHMAKSTVYLYFKSKEELFLECMERLMVIAVPEEAWEDIRKEKNYFMRLRKRGYAFQKAFPTYKGILTMTRAALGSDNQTLSEKAIKIIMLMTKPIAKDLRHGITDGIFREFDEDIIAHLILAMAEGIGCRLMIDSRYKFEQGMEIMYDFMLYGITTLASEKNCKIKLNLPSVELTDIKGIKTVITNIRFGETDYLPVKIGEAKAQIDPDTIQRITFVQCDSILSTVIITKDGNSVNVECDSDIEISGEASYGKFTIEIKNIDQILFVEPKN
jgi:AcrR family transcriptional regulator